MGEIVLALGTVVAAAIGVAVGYRGGLMTLLASLATTGLIAIAQYLATHPQGPHGASTSWPWGATSLIAYSLGLAFGLIVALR